jgi:YD repeat-containing protein
MAIAFLITSCGSNDNQTNTIFDDGNGTRTPRILKVVVKEDKKIISTHKYTYNSQNLLIEKDTSLKNNSIIYKYVYNEKKQLIKQSLDRRQLDTFSFFSVGTVTYNYNNVKPSLISSSSFEYGTYGGISTYITDYSYKFNNNDKVPKLAFTETKYKNFPKYDSHNEGIVVESYAYDLDNNLISKVDDESNKANYNYNSFGKLILEITSKEKVAYEYDTNQLLITSKSYKKNEDDIWKLDQTKMYYYENKPYYYRQSSTKIMGCTLNNCELVGDLGQYSNSGIY